MVRNIDDRRLEEIKFHLGSSMCSFAFNRSTPLALTVYPERREPVPTYLSCRGTDPGKEHQCFKATHSIKPFGRKNLRTWHVSPFDATA